MLEEVIPPVVTDERGDITVHASVEDACLWMEAIDVRDGIYQVFDSRGQLLVASAPTDRVTLRVDPTASPDRVALRALIARCIVRAGGRPIPVEDLERASLEQMLEAFLATS